MLVLSRKPGDEVIIGGEIAVKVLRVEGGRVVLGFDAPRDVTVRRAELPNRSARTGNVETQGAA